MALSVAQQRSLALRSSASGLKAPLHRARRATVRAAAGGKPKMEATGYVVDNSNKGNVFANKQPAYMKKGGTVEGLGGGGGLGVIGGIVAVVVALAVLVSRSGGPESLSDVAGRFEGDSLTQIAARVQKSI